MRKKLHFKFNLLVMLMLLVASATKAQDVTAVWDFQNNLPEGIINTNIQGTTNSVVSTVDSVLMYVMAPNGKLQGNTSGGYAQFNPTTILMIPVKSTRDVVTVTSFPGQHNYTVGGEAATEDVTVHRATAAEVKNKVVMVTATGTSYLYSIKVVQAGAIQEKRLYSTSFTDWDEVDRTSSDVIVNKKTLYSKEILTFDFNGVGIYPTGTNAKFSPNVTGYMQTAKYTGEYKKEEPNAVTSKLASITKITLHQAATGGNRGIKVSVKGDGDTDWVAIHNVAIANSKGEDLTLDVNRTNCQIKFENFTLNQNAYVSDLAIYGNVDMSKTPMLGSFSLNGTKYEAADIFEEDNTGKQIATINISKVSTLISEDNPLTGIVADNGTIKSTTYTTTGEGAAQKTVVTIVVATDDDEATYELTVGFKPDFTLTYYDVDGTTQLGTQAVEQDATITTFLEEAKGKVTVAEGKKFRGWASSLKKDEIKYTEDDQVKGDMNLYAVVTDIETANDTARYDYNLQKEGFCAADHESFVLNDNTQAGWHDANHGWVFKASDTIKILLGGVGYVKFGLCSYSKGTITLTSPDGDVVGTLEAKGSKDGAVGIIKNTISKSGTYTISFSEDGTYYFHDMSVVNETQDTYGQEGNWFTTVPGDGNSFISALEMANYNATQTQERSYVFVSDGVYDLGDKCLTTISGDNISIVGQSMENTIIMNTPTEEGIGITATLYNTSTGLYLQDLTLKNAYPYSAEATGRAVCLQDKGTNTICKNVKMLSYQDTYYSNNNSGKYYFEDSDIHGIVDFICGGGEAFFNKCTITLEPGKNSYITASYTNGTEYGYVFDGCKIVGTESYKFDLGRAWGGTAKCAFLNTVLDTNAAKNISTARWCTGGMNVLPKNFWEYNTLDESNNVISPAENTVKFTYKTDSIEYNTIMTAENAAKFSLDKVFSTWKPAELAAQKTVSDVKLENNKLSWTGDADYYMILRNGAPFYIVKETSFDVTNLSPETSEEVSQAKRKAAATVWGVRAANSMGGFGEAAYSGTTAIKAISSSTADTVSAVYYSVDGQQLAQPKSGVNIVVKTLADGTKKTEKVIVK